VGVSPTRRMLQPEATGAVMEVRTPCGALIPRRCVGTTSILIGGDSAMCDDAPHIRLL
jgi:hypothetical protein